MPTNLQRTNSPLIARSLLSLRSYVKSTVHVENNGGHFRLEDLPAELIFTILTFMDDESCLQMAQVSKHYNFLILPDFLSRNHIGHLDMISGKMALSSYLVLKGLRLATFLPPVRRLTCTFPYYASLCDLRQLELLSPRLHSADKIDISCDTESQFVYPVTCNITEKKIRRSLCKFLGSVTRSATKVAILTPSGVFFCKPSFFTRYRFTVPFRRPLFTPDFVARHVQNSSSLRVQNLIRTTSENISVVTVGVINYLFLNHNLSQDAWRAFLTSIHLPSLSSAHFRAPKLSIDTSTHFLNRHRNITSLVYFTCQVSIDEVSTTPKLSLPNLVYLTASSAYIASVFDSESCPRLRSIEIMSTRTGHGHDQYLGRALMLVGRCTNITHLALHNVDSRSEALQCQYCVPDQSLILPDTFPNITTLQLWELELWSGLPTFIERFPSVNVLGLNCTLWKGNGIRDGPWPSETRLIKSVIAVNNNISRVSVYGLEKAVAWWLEQEYRYPSNYFAF